MRTILIKNLVVQFDTFDDGADQHTALDMIDEINDVLKQRFPDAQPHISQSTEYDATEAVREENIEITLPEDERSELIERILDHCYSGDREKYRESNRYHLNEKSDAELEDQWNEWVNAQY